METDLKDLDQTGWVSYDLGGGAYYYGQIAYLDNQGALTQESNDKPIKHGTGVYIYTSNNQQITRYEGSWSNDLKNGQGKMVYEDGSIYYGTWRNGFKTDQGRMRWINGDDYEGDWKRDLMDGLGKFTHHKGKILKGTFKCNYFIEGDSLRNPFLNEDENKQFAEQKKNILKIKQRVSKQQLCSFQKASIQDFESIQKLIKSSNANNRIPLLFLSTETEGNISVFNQYSESTQQAHDMFDLRKAFGVEKQNRAQFEKQTGTRLSTILKEGGLYLISLDDSESHYDQKFYPNIKQYYSSNGFPYQIWSKSQLLKPEVYSKLQSNPDSVSPDFNIAIWSKYRLSPTLQNKQIIEKVERRFESVLPILKIDYLFLVK